MNITVMPVTSTVLYTSWQPPPLLEQNGVITHYTITVSDEDHLILINDHTDQLEITMEGLLPFHQYYVSIVASTKIGFGPYTREILVEMPEDGTYVCN